MEQNLRNKYLTNGSKGRGVTDRRPMIIHFETKSFAPNMA